MEQTSSDDENQVEQNGDIHASHRRGTTIDFHELSSSNPKTTNLSQTVSNTRRSLDGLSEEREITEFPNGPDGKPIRIRVRAANAASGGATLTNMAGHERQVTNRGFVETQTGLEPVMSVISKFGGKVDWRSQGGNTPRNSQNQQGNVDRMTMLEVDNMRRDVAQYKMRSETIEASRAELLKQLDHTKRHMHRLKAKLAKAEAEESDLKEELNRANHYLEIAEVFAREGGKFDDQVEKVKKQKEDAVSELSSVKNEIESLRVECECLARERDDLIARAEAAVLASKDAEKGVEELTEELADLRKVLEISSASKLEADERKLRASLAKDEECLMWKKEMREAVEELLQIGTQIARANQLEEKLQFATDLLEKLNAELEIYVRKLSPGSSEVENEEYRKRQDMLDSKGKEIEEVKAQIGKVKGEIDVLRAEVSDLQTEVEKGRIELDELKQKVVLALVEINSVKTEIEMSEEQTNSCVEKEKEAKRKIDELPSLVEEAKLEVKKSKLIAEDAENELNKVKIDAEPVLASLKTIKLKINAATKEIEASNILEIIASKALKALQESETESSSEKVTILFDEYFDMRKKGCDAAEKTEERLNAVLAEVETAKASEVDFYAMLSKINDEINEKKKLLNELEQNIIMASQRKIDAEHELKRLKEKSEEPADDVTKPDVKTNGDTEHDEDNNKKDVKLDEDVNEVPAIEVFRRSSMDDSFDGSNVCCLSGRRSNFQWDDETVPEYQLPVDSPTLSTVKKKRSLFRKFWTKRKAKSVTG